MEDTYSSLTQTYTPEGRGEEGGVSSLYGMSNNELTSPRALSKAAVLNSSVSRGHSDPIPVTRLVNN